jgi:hypothetical protein
MYHATGLDQRVRTMQCHRRMLLLLLLLLLLSSIDPAGYSCLKSLMTQNL